MMRSLKRNSAVHKSSQVAGLSLLGFAAITCLLLSVQARRAFTQNQTTTSNTGVLRLRVRVKIGDATRGLSRKRFFLVKSSLEQNKSLVETIDQRPLLSRECYFKRQGASQAFINWLKQSDCESVYCREIDQAAIEGANAVPEFVNAMAAGEKEYGSKELARKWLTTNLPDKLRDGYYRDRQTDLQSLIKQAESLAGGSKVLSVMTDRNGTAYFTELEPGTYFLSNLLPAELAQTSVIWNCQVQVKVGDLATEKPYLVSNTKDKNVKCVGVDKPLPSCETASN